MSKMPPVTPKEILAMIDARSKALTLAFRQLQDASSAAAHEIAAMASQLADLKLEIVDAVVEQR